MYLLNNVLAKFPLKNIIGVVGTILDMMSGKSFPDLRELGCVVIENLFSIRHVQSDYTQELLDKVLTIATS